MSGELATTTARPVRLAYRDGPPRAQPHTASGGQRIGAIVLLLGLGVVGLVVANGSARDVSHDPTVLLMIGAAFLFAVAVIGYTSLADDMQLSMQAMMLYFAIYLGLPGFNHASRNVYPFYGAHYDRNTQQNAALLLLLFLVCTVGSYILCRIALRQQPRARHGQYRIEPNVWLAVALTCAAAIATAFYVRTVGFGGIFVRRADFQVTNVTNGDLSTLGLLVDLPRTVCIASIVYAFVVLRFSSRQMLGALFVGLNLMMGILTLWPAALPRTTLFGVILFSATIFINFSKPSRRLALGLLYLVGALVAMPVVNAVSRGGKKFSELDMGNVFSSFFQSGDFDGFQSLNNAIVLVSHEGPQYGHQLLSALFFFVPRAIWSGKAQPTGAIAAEAAGYKFLNISMPLPGEFFADLSWVGVIIGGVAVGWLLDRLDRFIDGNWTTSARGRIVAGATIGYSTILFRGTLIGVIGPIAVLCALVFIMLRVGVPVARARPAARGGA